MTTSPFWLVFGQSHRLSSFWLVLLSTGSTGLMPLSLGLMSLSLGSMPCLYWLEAMSLLSSVPTS